MTKVAFVGAGSVIFTKSLLADMFRLPALRDVHVALHDIDARRLETAEAMAHWVARELGASPTVTVHEDRRGAVEGATAVLNMVQIGGHEATLRDFDIPAAYGLRQTIGDTLGVGGVFRALRTAPHMLALGNEIADLAPDAWLLNYTNPMAILCELVYQGTPTQNVVGLCHSVQYTVRDLAELVGVPEGEIVYLAAGVNHQAFLLRLDHEGRSLYPLLDERIDADPELARRVRVELYRRLGYFPTESSEHAAEYLPWFMHADGELEHYRTPVGEYIRRSEENLAAFERVREALRTGGPMELGDSVEYAAGIVNALVTGDPYVIYGNVENRGLLPGLPEGTCVEVPCLVDATGVRPTAVHDYPAHLSALNRTYVNVVELTVRAVLEGRPDYVRLAVALDPNASASLTLREIDAMCDELLAAHGDFIPSALRERMEVR